MLRQAKLGWCCLASAGPHAKVARARKFAQATSCGASLTTAMSHVAITELIDGKNVEWMEPVTYEQYQGGTLATD